MRKLLALVIQVPLVLSVYGACGGGGDTGDAGDGSVDVKAEKPNLDTGVTDTGTAACSPAPVSSSSLSWTPPRAPNPSACSDQQIADCYTACYAKGHTTTQCNTWKGANAGCQTCMAITVEGSASEFGPLISTGKVTYANVAGCIALEMNDVSATGCGAKYWARSQCEDLSCSNCCASTGCDTTTFQDYLQCTSAAASSECKPYVDAMCDLSDAGAVLAACAINNNSVFQDYFLAMGKVFCGGYPADAGPPSDGGSDASTDASSTDASADADDGSADATTD